MTIAHETSSSNGTGSTTVTPGLASGMQTGDACLVVIVTKPNTATIATPANWQVVGSANGGAGTNGASTGPTKVSVYFREKTAAWSSPPAFTVTSGNSTAAASFRFSKDPAAIWSHFNRNGTYNGTTPGLNMNVTETIDLMPGDYVCTASSNHDDAPRWGSQSYSLAGITFGTLNEFTDAITTTTGNDVGGAFWGAPVTGGVVNGTIAQQGTATANSTGAVVMVRLREIYPNKKIYVTSHAINRSYRW